MRNHALMHDHAVGDPSGGVRAGGRVLHDPITAGVVVGGGLIGAKLNSDAQGRAARKQQDALNQANQTAAEQFAQQREDNMPFLQTGYKANDQLTNLLASGALMRQPTFQDYQRDPSYQWQQDEAAKALQGSAAARGGLYSGNTLKALGRQAQNIASADYNNWWNRQQQGLGNQVNLLSAIRSGGQASLGQINQARDNFTNSTQANLIGMGDVGAAKSMGQANSWGNVFNGISGYGMTPGGSANMLKLFKG